MQTYVTQNAWFAMNDPMLLSLDELAWAHRRPVVRGGMSAENAGPVAETMLVCERDGVKSHGLLRLPGFVRSVQVEVGQNGHAPAAHRRDVHEHVRHRRG